MIRRFDHRSFDVGALVASKTALGRTVSMCLPARNEAATIGDIVRAIVGHPLVDEVLVVDDHSDDGTAGAAAGAGARVVVAADVLAEYGTGPGKGQALWKATATATGDLIAFCDADVRDFDPLRGGPARPAADRTGHGRLRQGVLPAPGRRSSSGRRAGHGARRPAAAPPALPAPGRRRAAVGRRVRRAPERARAVAVRRGLRRRHRAADRRRGRAAASTASPRWTSAFGSTATGRCRSSAPWPRWWR